MPDDFVKQLHAAQVESSLVIAADEFLMSRFDGADWSNDTTVIHDLDGTELVRRVSLRRDGRSIGYVDVVLDPRIGNPLRQISDYPWDGRAVEERGLQKAHEEGVDPQLLPPRFVFYDYPKVGLQFGDGRESVLLLDALTLTEVARAIEDEVGDVHDQYRWSLLEKIGFEARERNKKNNARWIESLEYVYRSVSERESGYFQALRALRVRKFLLDIEVNSKYIRYLRDSSSHVCSERRHQINSLFCVPASVQMVLDYFRYWYEQNTIAQALGLLGDGRINALPCAREEFNIIDVLERLSGDSLCCKMNACPGSFWVNIRDEVESNRPMILRSLDHARVIFGFKEIYTMSLPLRFIVLRDPLPIEELDYVVVEAYMPELYRLLFYVNQSVDGDAKRI